MRLCRPTVGAQLLGKVLRRFNGTFSYVIFACKWLNMPPSTRANVPAVDDEPADGAGEQHASRPMLNIDMAVSAAVERQFELRSSEMVAQMIAALESREARTAIAPHKLS